MAAALIDDAVRVAERVCSHRRFLGRVGRHVGGVGGRTRYRPVARRSGGGEGRDGMRLSSCILTIKPLIGKVGEI
jgi:hypothetical protein